MIKSDWHGLKDLEKDGLRVPTVFELIHLRKNSDYREGWFWSSSPYVYGSDYAWGVYFVNGNVSSYYKDDAFYVRLVRAGQSFDHWHSVTAEEVATFRESGVLPDWHPPIDESMVADEVMAEKELAKQLRFGWPLSQDEINIVLDDLGIPLATLAGLASGRLVAVPVEPTRAMWAAAGDAIVELQNKGIHHHDRIAAEVYRAMIEAA